MINKHHLSIGKWMVRPTELVSILVVIALTIGGLYASVSDALQLRDALNLNLTQALIVSQGIVNLQREVQLTHNEVLHRLGELDDPPQPISRFDFVQIQVSNLTTVANSPSSDVIFGDEDKFLIQDIENRASTFERLLRSLENASTPQEEKAILSQMDSLLQTMEGSVKQLVDRQALAQRNAIIQTRDSLAVSQRTSILAGGVLLLMAAAVAALIRRVLTARLQQAIEADRLKGQLLANVSHELRTPLAAISGYSQLLDDESYGTLTEKQHTTVQRILVNTTQLQGMVNNLLDRAQIEQGKLSLRNAPFAPADLIKSTQATMDVFAKEKSVQLTSEVAPDVPATLSGDELRLQQILFNLTSNALKFTEKGSVHMRIFLPDKNHWALQVADTGIGISSEGQAQVFEPFWQADSTATRQYRGSGLGLSIVKQLSDLMGGKIKLASKPEQGSTFTVTFPLESKQ
jgi:signal transduction histidine kinase